MNLFDTPREQQLLSTEARDLTASELARRDGSDVLDAFSWTTDVVGFDLLHDLGFRDRLAALVRGEDVPSAQRIERAWMAGPAGPGPLVIVEPGAMATATIDSAALTVRPGDGVPPTRLRATMLDGRDVDVVVALTLDGRRAAISEVYPAGFIDPAPGIGALKQTYPAPGRSTSVPRERTFDDGRERFDEVQPIGVYLLVTDGVREMAALVADAAGAPRAWLTISGLSELDGVGISSDNRRLARQSGGPVRAEIGAPHLAMLQRRGVDREL